jgi:hypothetical protein
LSIHLAVITYGAEEWRFSIILVLAIVGGESPPSALPQKKESPIFIAL